MKHHRIAVSACLRLLALVFLFYTPGHALEPPGKLAIQGYDPVAYFTEQRPVPGKPEFAYDWDGLRFQFASAAHRDRFAADPDRYAPNYGGNCAGTMAMRGERLPANPNYWLIIDGKLYLFAGQRGFAMFEKDHGMVRQSDEKWSATKKPVN